MSAVLFFVPVIYFGLSLFSFVTFCTQERRIPGRVRCKISCGLLIVDAFDCGFEC